MLYLFFNNEVANAHIPAVNALLIVQ